MKEERIRKGKEGKTLLLAFLLMLLCLLPKGQAEAATKIKGIDVSKWQGQVDWEKVKKDGVEFVMLGVGRYRNGKGYLDPNFTYNMKNALKQNIHVGIYLYSEAVTVKEARGEANFVLKQIDGYKVSYPVAFDIEDTRHMKLTTKQRTDITIAFLDVIEKAGYHPMIYASENWLNERMDLKRLTKYDKWVARWSGSVSYRPLAMWQYSSKGRIRGISGDVDLDYSYRDYAKLLVPRTHAKGSEQTEETKESEREADSKEQGKQGWVQEGDRYWYRKEDGSRAKKGWLKLEDGKYYLNSDGYRVTGWQKIGKQHYYFIKKTGAAKTGWLKLGGKYYYLDKDGVRKTGWIHLGEKQYYLDKNGVRKTGWLKYGGRTYLLKKNGEASKGWTEEKGKTYYFNPKNGRMSTGWLKLDGEKYYLNKNGTRAAGWTKVKGKWYYFDKKSGAMKHDCKVGKYKIGSDGVCRNYRK